VIDAQHVLLFLLERESLEAMFECHPCNGADSTRGDLVSVLIRRQRPDGPTERDVTPVTVDV